MSPIDPTTPTVILDVDGVLAPLRDPGEDAGMDWRCVENAFRIARRTNCRFVLSSAWRYSGYGPNSIYCQCLQCNGSHGERVAEWTVAALPLEPPGQPISRDDLIMAWVREHKPKRWVAIDDLSCIKNLPSGHWLQTNGGVGLTSADADKVIAMLTRSR